MAIDIVHGDSAAASVGGAPLVRRDLLTWGRCDVDPAEHRAARMRHWGIDEAEAAAGLIGVDDLGRKLPPGEPIVVWTSGAWPDRLYTWCLFDAFARLGVAASRVRIARASGRSESLGAYSHDELRAIVPVDISDAEADAMRALWLKFAARSPLAFDEARRRDDELARAAEGHFAWFPRRDHKRLRIGAADEELFQAIGDAWRPKRAVLGRAPRLLGWLGDRGVFERLAAWRDKRAVELRGEDVRLTVAGKRLLEGGGALADFAPIWIGGCHVNDPRSPWVRNGGRLQLG